MFTQLSGAKLCQRYDVACFVDVNRKFLRHVKQVINMICSIRDDSPNNVASALENVLDALRSSELYAPHLLHHVREDKVVNDLVEGLMTVCAPRFLNL